MTFTNKQKEAAARALFARNEPASKRWEDVDHTYRSQYLADVETVIAELEKHDDAP